MAPLCGTSAEPQVFILSFICFDNYNVMPQQKNNIPVQLYLSNNGKCAIVCLSSQNGKLRKTSLVDLKDLLTVNIDMFDSVKDWLDKFIRKAS